MKLKSTKWLVIMALFIFNVNLQASNTYPDASSRETKGKNISKIFKIKGDLRIRYQWEKKKNKKSRERERIRFRLGFKTYKIKNFIIGAGIASGNGDPRSTNVTLTNSFSMKDIKINYAYAEYRGIPYINLWAGKYEGIKKAIWTTSDLIWDSDLTPEGAGLRGEYSLKQASLFTNAGFWIIEERKNGADSNITYIQLGGKVTTGGFSLATGISYFDSHSVKGYSLQFTSETNSYTPDKKLLYDYNTIEANMQLKMKNLISATPCIALFGTYVRNLAVSQNSTGYLAGFKMGYEKLKRGGKWQFKIMYRYLEKDAWLDIFPDSDAYGGKTGVKGYEAEGKIMLIRGLLLGIDYYLMRPIETPSYQNLIQVDLVWKI